jgi:hypothetical protein
MSVQPGEGDTTRAVDQEDDPQGASATGGVASTGAAAATGGTDQRPAPEAAPQQPPVGPAGADTAGTAVVATPDQKGRKDPRGGRTRRIVVGVLVFLFAVLLPLSYVVTWAHYVVLTNRGFEKTVIPVGTDPAVTSAVAATITDQIFTSLNPQQTVANALPPRAAFLAGPITNAAKGYVQTGVTRALQSSQFQTLWKQAVDFAHEQLLSVLNGNTKAITTTNGQVVLNLVPLFDAALQNLQGFISGVVGHPVNLPSIQNNEIPASACQRIGSALNRPISDTCGQIPLFPEDKLIQARHAVRIFNGVMVLLLVLTAAVVALALWLSRRRRRTLLQLCVAGVLGLVVIRRVVDVLSTSLVDTGLPANKDARRAILSHIFHQYFSISRWLLLGIIAVFVVALVTGPYGWARALRPAVVRWAKEGWNLVVAISGRARDDRTIEWVRAHLDLLRVLGVALAILLLVVLSVSWIGLLVILVLLVGYEWWLFRLGQSRPGSAPADGSGSTPSDPSADRQPTPGGQAPVV